MTTHRELAAQLAGNIFDHVEHERIFVRHRIEDVIHDGLLLGQAKQPGYGRLDPGYQQVLDEAAKLVRMFINDISLGGHTPSSVCRAIDQLYDALRKIGWRP